MTTDESMCVPVRRLSRRVVAGGVARSVLAAILFVTVWTPAGPSSADGSGQPTLPTVELAIGDRRLLAELAVTGEQRYRGLSHRTSLASDAGMLFVYDRERPLTFTMRDTLLPLSIAFLTDELVIDEIIDMDVGPGQLFPSARPARYALEVNQGWFERHGIEPGARVTLTNGMLP